MDLHLTEEQTAFRQEVRDFLDENLPSDWIGGPISFAHVDKDTEMKWRKMLAEKGWNTMGWPEEYGGQGASAISQLIFPGRVGVPRGPGNRHLRTQPPGPDAYAPRHGRAEEGIPGRDSER